MTTRQAGLSRLRFSIKQTNTSWRFGIADQHTLNASPIQAPRSSEVSATAAEHKKALINAAVTGITAFIDVDVFNVLNAATPTNANFTTGPSFGFVSSVIPARIARLGVRFLF